MTQIEYGDGRVWSFAASVAVTSGQVVYVDAAKVRPTSAASQHVFGVALMPASAGKQVSIIMEGIVKVQTTGVGDSVGGALFGAGAGGYAEARTNSQLNERRLDLGFAIENITRNTKGKIKLCW